MVACVALAASMANAQLLYSISGKGLEKPSYILGTYHFASSSFTKEIPGFQKAIDETEQVCGEVVMAEMNSPENMAKMQNAMMLPEGKTIQQMLSEDELSSLNVVLKQLLGADFSTPIVSGQLGKLTPGALSLQLTSLLYLKKNPSFNLNDGIDTYVQTLATNNKKGTLGLETIDQQVKLLLEAQTLERQKELLMCFVNHLDYQMQMTEDLVKAYYAKDLEGIEKLGDMKLGDSCDNTEEEDYALVEGRNTDWVAKMPAIMSEKPTFFAVGAAHLIGEKGVLQQLKDAGYTIAPVE